MFNRYRKALTREKQKVNLLLAENKKLQARQEVMEVALRQIYSESKKHEGKQVLKQVAQEMGNGKYKKPDHTILGLKGRIRKRRKQRLPPKRVAEELKVFYERDDISRSTAGKKETRTKNKNKMQIRYLVDTLENLYKIYKNEGGKYSFTTFFRYKPYYVLSPSFATRDTCMCIKHSNMEYMFNALKLKGVIPHKSMSDLLTNVACDTKSFECMHGKCEQCKDVSIQYDEDKKTDEITWYKWTRINHKYEKAGKIFTTKKSTKQQKKCTIPCARIQERNTGI